MKLPLQSEYCTKSFAYLTVKDRLPTILTKAVDTVHRHKKTFFEKYGQEGVEAEKRAIGLMSKLRNELQTDKAVIPLTDEFPDAAQWNTYIERQQAALGPEEFPSWFKSSWLFMECYMYRRIHESILLNPPICDFDVFSEAKIQSFFSSQDAILIVCTYLQELQRKIENFEESQLKDEFMLLMQVALWGNRCDLSISGGQDNSQKNNPLASLESLKSFILVDDSERVWNLLVNNWKNKTSQTTPIRVDIVLDNSGFELVTDLVLAYFLLSTQLADEIHFHGKSMPWFVSDTTRRDLDWTLKNLQASNHASLSMCGNMWEQNLHKGVWVYHDHLFWTLPHEFSDMSQDAPDLYSELHKSNLIFFKGDLNYRKLTGDRKWSHTISFDTALQGFHPAPLCSLRTLKADIQVGLKPEQAEQLTLSDPQWLVSGNYAIIQFSDPNPK
uniref:Sugar phosphate phosphatase n=1 Tax=Callorhinchus milii TaxID=7868 RepID=A0A4W3HEQ6_CALMI